MKNYAFHRNLQEERREEKSRAKSEAKKRSRRKRLWRISIMLIVAIAAVVVFSSCSSKENGQKLNIEKTESYYYVDQYGKGEIFFSQGEPKNIILERKLSEGENAEVIRAGGKEISLPQPREFQEYEGLKRSYTVTTYTAQYNTLFNRVYIVNTKTEPTSSFAWELIVMFLILVVYGFLIHQTSLNPTENQIDYEGDSLAWRFSLFFFKVSIVFLVITIFNNYVFGDSIEHLIYLLIILASFVLFSFISGFLFDKESRNRNFLSVVTALGSVYLLTAGYYHWGLVTLSFFIGILIAQIIYLIEQWNLKKLDLVDRELKMVRKNRKF